MSHVTHMSDTCHTHFTHMTDTCKTHVTHMSHTCHTHVRHMSHTQTHRHMSDTQTHRHTSDTCQTNSTLHAWPVHTCVCCLCRSVRCCLGCACAGPSLCQDTTFAMKLCYGPQQHGQLAWLEVMQPARLAFQSMCKCECVAGIWPTAAWTARVA